MEKRKVFLDETEIPKNWYNIQADLPKPLKFPLNPETKEPVSPDDLAVIFPPDLIAQEVSTERWIPIPEEVLKVYLLWRPTPLIRAVNLEKALGTPARIYYKYEGVSPAGSHKPNTAVAQAYYNKKAGIKRLSTETGAGQWGSALALAGKLMGVDITVYMVRVSYDQKPYRRILMETWGAEVFASPSENTQFGKKILSEDPNTPGSLGIAISEAIEDAATHKDTNYSLGSVLNHVVLHQTIIGEEALAQFKKIGDYPDIVIGCIGGGSNFAGASFSFVRDKIYGKDIKVIAVEPTACPTLTKGLYCYDFGDSAGMTPLIYMYTLGHKFIPPGIHAGGLRYHGMAPLVSLLHKEGLIEAYAYHQNEVFSAAVAFSRAEGYLPAPETAHAIKAVFDEAIKCKEEGKEKVIFFNFSGHGHFDLSAYENYLCGNLKDYDYPEDKVKEALSYIPKV